MSDLEFREETFQPGKYVVRVTKIMSITVNTPYTINQSTLCTEVLALGTTEEWKVEKL
jgi:hypothetical protein